MSGCSITDEYCRRGIDTVFLENEHIRVEVLSGKGGDITEIRDKRTDTNVLFESPHSWRPPSDGIIGAPDGSFAFLDHYPGGWQDVLPAAGGPTAVAGAPFGLHGESSLIPWRVDEVDDSETEVALSLSVSLTRYPFDVKRRLSLREGESTLRVTEYVTNRGSVETPYSWLQHIALGPPLVGPSATLDVPCETVLVDPGQTNDTARLPPGDRFDWPLCDVGDETVDLRTFPSPDERVHDLVALTDLTEGRYTVTNPALSLGVTVRFPHDLFEYLWYWQAFGGFESAPFFGRNYNAGLEPCTSIPNAGLEEAIVNGTANRLGPGETLEATIEFETHPAERR